MILTIQRAVTLFGLYTIYHGQAHIIRDRETIYPYKDTGSFFSVLNYYFLSTIKYFIDTYQFNFRRIA